MLRKAIPVSSFILSLATALFAGDGRVVAYPFGPPARLRAARNVIFLVPDGMGLADVTATRIFKNGPGGDPLNLESLDYVGYQRTWAADATITDSAAAASAWACGEKFEDGQVCMRRDGSFPPSLLEIARDHGRRTGLVATSTITNATPAAFGSHVARRCCETEIAPTQRDREKALALYRASGGRLAQCGNLFDGCELPPPWHKPARLPD